MIDNIDNGEMVVDENGIEVFKELSIRALETEETETFVECLLKRQEISDAILQDKESVPEEETVEHLAREREILKRLVDEKNRIITDIEEHARSMRAVKVYKAKFPFPAMPAFVDTTT
ncbi:MAG: hypothetical protein A4E58_00920 [Syntrophorhabdus sp. PtaB.Bin006]|nr:MAG: hypothetical protein A4E58_00920 [Syntrophorhabdus sp. PtaB.Bin006]